jgi:uncharacterized membrane protein YdjX (TVP38/TMEM64 family)
LTLKRRLLLLAAGLAAAFALVALGVPRSPHELQAAVEAAGPAAPVVFVVAWALLTPALFSGTLLSIAAGLAFGLGSGTLVGVAGGTLGAVLAFVIARHLGHGAIDELAGPRVRSLAARLERRGFVSVLCARMAPGMPATLLNYACGLSRVRLRAFAPAVAIGGAPRMAAYAGIGASGGDISSLPALIGGALLLAFALWGLGVALRRRLRAALAA